MVRVVSIATVSMVLFDSVDICTVAVISVVIWVGDVDIGLPIAESLNIHNYNYPLHACAQRGYVIGHGVGVYISARVQFDLLKYLLSELHSGSRRLPIIFKNFQSTL
jgi:hypothetical protein